MNNPTATYRVQFNVHFRFADLDKILDYLHELGISTIYASPLTTAQKGSQHGYDVTDPLTLNPEIGTEEEFAALAARLREYGMSWLQDIVPNHMAYSPQNPWIFDVLERGKVSPYYTFFDFHPEPLELLGERIMAPFLGAPLAECLASGELTLQYGRDGFVLRHFDTDWPVAVHLYAWISTVSGDCPERLKGMLEELVIASLSPVEEWKAAKVRWMGAVEDDASLMEFMARRVTFFNERLPMLETLAGCQHYALTHHQLSSSLINYRRFFTVNSLICLRMESREVFDAYHNKIAAWCRRGWIQGLRIDHIDGLAAPAEYLGRLRECLGPAVYLVAEKILARDEALPGYWECQGTTGYDFLAAAGQVLTDPAGSRALLDWYASGVVQLPQYPELVTDRKYDFLRTYMVGELNNLMDMLRSIPGAAGHDVGRLGEALAMLLACFPVYRLYPDGGPFTFADKMTIASAIERARLNRPECRAELDWLDELFLLPGAEPFLMRMMQFTGPLAAKGIEDTTFYVYNPYIAHCEVGDTPAVAGIEASAFHRFMKERQSRWPHSLNATTTHDTKRGEDARIRLNLLSAQPGEWIEAVRLSREMNQEYLSIAGTRRAPSANDEYLIYQALLGGWPADAMVTDEFRGRFGGYLQKALREARTETNYDDPDEWYEGACQAFASALLKEGSEFLVAFGAFAMSVAREAFGFGLAQVLLKLTAPGIPDIYQGSECWDLSFVDPDNRRAVDYAARAAMLREIRAREAGSAGKPTAGLGVEPARSPLGVSPAALDFVLDHPERSAMKMWVVYRVLGFRRAHPALFSEGEYVPVEAEGPVLAFVRRLGSDWVLVLAPLIRMVDETEAGAREIRIGLPAEAPREWLELFTGDVHHCIDGALTWRGWDRFPAAMLVGR